MWMGPLIRDSTGRYALEQLLQRKLWVLQAEGHGGSFSFLAGCFNGLRSAG